MSAGRLNFAAIESPGWPWPCVWAQKRAFQSCAGALVGMEMAVFGGAGTPYLAFGRVHRSREREKCYRAIDIIEQKGGCRIISKYGYSPGVQRSSCAALVGNLRHQ